MSTTLLGKYEIERELGRGGMGYVVLARHLELDERVAIKFLLPAYANHQELVARFLREARAAVKIKSEHVGRVLDVGRAEDGSPYMVMEFLEGEDLGKHSEQRGPMPIPEAVEYLLQACEALAEAHALGIIHRDLKPANMFLTHRVDGTPRVKVLDFGISKLGSNTKSGLTQTHGLMGSPLYMSPEQYRSPKDVDVRSDIYALGVVLYELISRQWPVLGETAENHMYKVLHEPAAPITAARPDVPPGLAAVIHRALDKDRNARFQNIVELAEALAPYAPPTAQISVQRIAASLKQPRLATGPMKSLPDTVIGQAPEGFEAPEPEPVRLGKTTSGGGWKQETNNPAAATTAVTAPKRSALVVPIFALVALLGVGGAAFALKGPSTPAAPAASKPAVEKPPDPIGSEHGARAESSDKTPSPDPAPAESKSAASPPASTPPTNTMAKPPSPPGPKPKASTSASTTTTVTTATTTAPSAPPTPNCSPPYVIDDKGHKVPKPECL